MIQELKIRPFYTVPQLAKMIGYSSQGARKFLFKLNLPINLVGNRYIVYLTDLQSYTPQFYNSILEAQNLNSLINKDIIEDNDVAMQEQFYRCEKDQFLNSD
jgi:hypothetical protein